MQHIFRLTPTVHTLANILASTPFRCHSSTLTLVFTHRKPGRRGTVGRKATACTSPRRSGAAAGRTAARTGRRTRTKRWHSRGSYRNQSVSQARGKHTPTNPDVARQRGSPFHRQGAVSAKSGPRGTSIAQFVNERWLNSFCTQLHACYRHCRIKSSKCS